MSPVLQLLCLAVVVSQAGAQSQVGRKVTKAVKCADVEKAAAGDTVSIHYTGKLAADGKQFDSSIGGKPISFELGKGVVIAGWDQGLVGACPGEGLELTIPPELGYGEKGAGKDIPPNAALVFTLTVESIQKSLKIEILKASPCDKEKQVRSKDKITLNYRFRLADGKVVDDSYERGEPLEMEVGKVGIVGWDDGVKGACPGEIRRVTVPANLGYGDKGIEGMVPPGATIVLELEVLSIRDRTLSFLDQISSGTFGNGK
jgi:FKBP-type peptidyl-prolyl cis-trans isomerase